MDYTVGPAFMGILAPVRARASWRVTVALCFCVTYFVFGPVSVLWYQVVLRSQTAIPTTRPPTFGSVQGVRNPE